MMAHSVLVAALLINSLSYCFAENVYCVTPTPVSCLSCPYDSIHCAILSEYAQKAELYFTSNTTLVFLSGDHALDTNITVAKVARLSMCGESSDNMAAIVCNGQVGLSFTSTMEIKIYSLAFTSCSRDHGISPVTSYALLLQSTQHAELVNCLFHDNLGTALVVNNTNTTLAGNRLNHNRCESCLGGCGITALNCKLTFTGNTVFLGNFVTFCRSRITSSGGGAVYASHSTELEFIGISNFINNSAYNGGAIFASDNTVLSFSGTNYFTNNSAYLRGGAIYASENTVLHLNGLNIFFMNSVHNGDGGAIYTSKNTVINFNGTNNFISNSADNGVGGATLTLSNSTLCFNGTNNFIFNTAGVGGAIFTENTVLSNGTNNFINNTADESGAIAALNNALLEFNGNNNFFNNSAGACGAVSASNSVVLNFNGTNNFINNSAGSGNGGVIFTFDSAVISFNGINVFISNSVADSGFATGGAIVALDNAVLNFNGTNNFIKNSAHKGDGGALYALNNVVVNFNGTNNFISNSAMQCGGAIYTDNNSTLTFNGTTNFTNNGGQTAYGGGMCMGLNSSFYILPNSTVYWEKNRANFGGAIYVDDAIPLSYCTSVATYVPKEKCFFQLKNLFRFEVQLVFKNNSAKFAGSVLYGGAIDNCKLTGVHSYSSGEVFDMLSLTYPDYNVVSKISSAPFRICPCVNNQPACSDKI